MADRNPFSGIHSGRRYGYARTRSWSEFHGTVIITHRLLHCHWRWTIRRAWFRALLRSLDFCQKQRIYLRALLFADNPRWMLSERFYLWECNSLFPFSVHSFENWEVAEDSISLYNIKFCIVKNIRLWRKLYIYIESKLVATIVTNVRRLFVKCLKLFANYIFIFHILNFIFI